MSKKITFKRPSGAGTVTETITFPASFYSLITDEWEMDEVEKRGVYSGKFKRVQKGWYLVVRISLATMKNQDFFNLRHLFTVGTTEIYYYPDTNSVERYAMDIPKKLSSSDFLETFRDDVEIELRSKDRYATAMSMDISYIGTRKIDINSHAITIGGTLV